MTRVAPSPLGRRQLRGLVGHDGALNLPAAISTEHWLFQLASPRQANAVDLSASFYRKQPILFVITPLAQLEEKHGL